MTSAHDIPSWASSAAIAVFPLEAAAVHLQLSQLDVAENIGVCRGGTKHYLGVRRHAEGDVPMTEARRQGLHPSTSAQPATQTFHTLPRVCSSAGRGSCHASTRPPATAVLAKPLHRKANPASLLHSPASSTGCVPSVLPIGLCGVCTHGRAGERSSEHPNRELPKGREHVPGGQTDWEGVKEHRCG